MSLFNDLASEMVYPLLPAFVTRTLGGGPLLLGLLVAMPVLFGSLYASYQAIFAVWADEAAPVQAADNLA